MEEKDNEIELVAIELVAKLRRLHFQEGTSKTARTKQIKEVVEHNARKIDFNAS